MGMVCPIVHPDPKALADGNQRFIPIRIDGLGNQAWRRTGQGRAGKTRRPQLADLRGRDNRVKKAGVCRGAVKGRAVMLCGDKRPYAQFAGKADAESEEHMECVVQEQVADRQRIRVDRDVGECIRRYDEQTQLVIVDELRIGMTERAAFQTAKRGEIDHRLGTVQRAQPAFDPGIGGRSERRRFVNRRIAYPSGAVGMECFPEKREPHGRILHRISHEPYAGRSC